MKSVFKYIVLTFVFLYYPAYTATLLVDNKKNFNIPNKQYQTLIQAVKESKSFDTIIVNKGFYSVQKLVINKPLIIIGRDNPILDGKDKAEILIINADSVTVRGFILKNVPLNYIEDWAAIRINHSEYCTIKDNILLNTFFGIYLNRSKHCVISGNIVKGNAVKELNAGNAIHLWYSDFSKIENNKISGHRDGIYLEFSKHSRITGNLSKGNLRYGLHFMFCDENTYRKNKFERNGAGVAVMFSKKVGMYENTFCDNVGASSYGLLLKDIVDSKIINNKIYGNTVGIMADGASRCLMQKNNFKRNGWAIKILGSSINDTVTKNNFISNTFDISTNSSTSTNIFLNNYWGKYTGYDLNKDGIGDIPYRPVKLFSYITANSKESLILLRSLFVNLLEFAESITPIFTPLNLTDDFPLMEPVK